LQGDEAPKQGQRVHKGGAQIRTVGRWPWKLESGKKRVATYLSNLRVPKMDGADLEAEAPDAWRGRRAGLYWGRACASAAGGAFRADLGSSSISMNVLRRVRPLNRRRLRESI